MDEIKGEGTMKLKKLVAGVLSLAMVFGVCTMTSCGKEEVTADPLKQTTTEGVLVVGLDDTFAPMGYRDENNDLVGFDIDLANAVGEELGMKIEFQPISWDAKDLELKSGNIDCIWNGMSVTPERLEAMSLSKKYLNNNIVLMTDKGNDVVIENAKDLAGYKIGTQADSAALEMLMANEEYDNFKDNITEYGDYDKALLDLKAGRVDVIAIDQVLGEFKNNNLGGELDTCDYAVGEDAYAIGFRKENPELRDLVNDAIKKVIDNGKAEQISNKWFGKNIVIFEDAE